MLKKNVCPSPRVAELCVIQARIAKVTELLLMGYRWREVKETMMITHEEFSELLLSAVAKAHAEATQDPHTGQLGPVHWPAGQ